MNNDFIDPQSQIHNLPSSIEISYIWPHLYQIQ